MIKFVHTADIHFGMENYGRIDPATGIHTRLLDFHQSLLTCAQRAIDEKVDFFLFSGDAYKTAHPTPTQQKLLMEVFFKLVAAGIPVVIVVGNHDHPLSFGKANALDVFGELPIDGFHVFSKPESMVLQTKSGPVQIVGIPWPTRNNVAAKKAHQFKKSSDITKYLSTQVSKIIAKFAQELDPDMPAVLCGHLTVSNGIFSGSEKCAVFGSDPLFLPSELALPQFDYVALGHLHRYQNLNPKGYPAVVYSGSIDRVDFGERKEGKGFCLVSIQSGVEPTPDSLHRYKTKATHEFVPLTTRPFIQIEVKLEGAEFHTSQVLDAIKKHQIKDAIVKLLYHVPPQSTDKVDISAIQRALREAMYVVGVIPVREVVRRQSRVALKVDMDFQTVISRYIDSRDELKEMRGELLEKARKIYGKLEAEGE